jgi:hypothetical protein
MSVIKSLFFRCLWLLLIVPKWWCEPRLLHNENTRKGKHSYNACGCFCFDDNNYPNSRRKVLQQIVRQAPVMIAGFSSSCVSFLLGGSDPVAARDVVMENSQKVQDQTSSDEYNSSNNNNPDNGNAARLVSRKPFAPPMALIPAARVKYVIEESLRLLDRLEPIQEQSKRNNALDDNDGRDDEIINDIVVNLQRLIYTKTFMSPLSLLFSQEQQQQQQVSSFQAIKTNDNLPSMDPMKSKIYQESYNEKLKGMSPINVPYALLVKAGDLRQLKQLQKKQETLEKQNPVREAFNYYTRQLQFDTEYYLLNVSAQEKKKMIRNDELPDIKSVIVSDLDLRDLVRNQVLDAYDDVKFELRYQVSNYHEKGLEFDASGDLKAALVKAKNECDEWFSFISDQDVNEAMDTVMKERGSFAK